MNLAVKRAGIALAAAALALPIATVSTTANAGTEPPPCTKKAIKKAVQKSLLPDATVKSIDSKYCKDYWASGAYVAEFSGGEDEDSYLLEDDGGKWKAVSEKRHAKLCKPKNDTLPNKIKNHACVN